jgi:hypothetical protein
VQDAVGDRELADVVELGGTDQHIEIFGLEPGGAPDPGGEAHGRAARPGSLIG